MKPDVNGMTVADAARAYVAEGWPVVLLHRPITGPSGTTICSCGVDPAAVGRDHKVGKHPITSIHPHGSKDAISDLPTLEAALGVLATEALPANLAVILPPGVACLDLDPPRGDRTVPGTEALGSWMAAHPSPSWEEMKAAPSERTGSGGLHMLVADLGISQRVGAIPGVDYLRSGSMLVVAPSLHPTGETNTWLSPPTLGASFPPVPTPLAEFLRPLGGYAQLPPGSVGISVSFDAASAARQLGGRWPARTAAWGASAAKGAEDTLAAAIAAGPGKRNNELFRQACAVFQLAQLGVLDADSTTERLARRVLDDNMGSDEVASTIRSARMRAQGSLREVRKGFLADLVEAAEAAGIAVPVVAGATEHATTKEITPERYAEATAKICDQVTTRLGPTTSAGAVRAEVGLIVDSALHGPGREVALGICEHAANLRHAAIGQVPWHFLAEDVGNRLVDRAELAAAHEMSPAELVTARATDPARMLPQPTYDLPPEEYRRVLAEYATRIPPADLSTPQWGCSPEMTEALAAMQATLARGEEIMPAAINELQAMGEAYHASRTSAPAPAPVAEVAPVTEVVPEPTPVVVPTLTRSEVASMVSNLGRAAAVLSPTWAGREDAAEAIVAALDAVTPTTVNALLATLDLPEAIDRELVLIDSIARAGGVPTSVERHERAEAKTPDPLTASSLVLAALACVDIAAEIHLPSTPPCGRLSAMAPIAWPQRADRDPGVVVEVGTAPVFARFGSPPEQAAALDVLEAARTRFSPAFANHTGISHADAEAGTRVLWAEALASWQPYGGKAAQNWAFKATERDLKREVAGRHAIDRTAARLDAPAHRAGRSDGETLATLGETIASSMANDPVEFVATGRPTLDLDWLEGALPKQTAEALGRQVGCFGYDPQSPQEIATAMDLPVGEVQALARNALRTVIDQLGESLGRSFSVDHDPPSVVAGTADILEMDPVTVAHHFASVIMRSANGARRLAPVVEGAGGIDAWAERVGSEAQEIMGVPALARHIQAPHVQAPHVGEQKRGTPAQSQPVPERQAAPVPERQPAPTPALPPTPVFENLDDDPTQRLVPALSMRMGR